MHGPAAAVLPIPRGADASLMRMKGATELPATARRARAAAAAALAVAIASAAGAACAADPVRGASLYANPARPGMLPCADCHAEDPIVNNFGNIWSGRNAVALIERAVQSNTGGMGVFQGIYGPAELADIAAYLGNAPITIEFAAAIIGTTGAARTVTISSSLKVGIETLTLATEGDFAIAGTGCGSSVPRFSSCTVDVVFRPTATGARSGALVIAHAGTPTPVRLPLAGEGLPPPAEAVVSPARVDFGAAGGSRSVEVANFSASPLRLIALATTPSQFAIAGGTCVPGLELRTGGRCAIALRAPERNGAEQRGVLTLAHDGVGGGTTVELAASGDAAAPSVLAASPLALDFGTHAVGAAVPARMVTVVNRGAAPVALVDAGTSETAFAIERSTCIAGTMLAPQQACQVAVAFKPAREGPVSAELRLATAAPVPALRVPLAALATAGSVRAIPARIAPRASVGGSARATVAVVNAAASPLRLGALRISGPDAADFAVADGGACRAGSAVPPHTHCTLDLVFTPGASGARLARLRIETETGSSTEVELSGTGTTAPTAEVWLDTATLDFGAVAPGAALSRRVTVRNRGAADLRWSQIALAGSAAAGFSLGGDCAAGASLAAGSSCSIDVRYAPGGVAAHVASLVLWHEAATAAAVVSISGRGVAAGAASLAADRLAIDFGHWPLQSPAAVQRLRLRNVGTAKAPALDFAIDAAAFTLLRVDPACAAGLAPGESCALDVGFKAAGAGSHRGLLRITGAGLAALPVDLGGSAGAASPLLAWQTPNATPSHGATPVGAPVAGPAWTLVNTGNAPSSPLRWVVDGPAATEFSLAPESACTDGLVLAPGANCTVRVSFHPQVAGMREARLLLASDGLDPVALAGRASAPASGSLQAMPPTIVFQARTTASAVPQSAHLRNDGAAALRIDALGITGTAFSFSASAADACGGEPRVLLPGESCEIGLAWDGSAGGALGGQLIASSTASFGASVPLLVREDPAQRSNAGGGGGALHWAWLLLAALLAGGRALRSESPHG